MDGRTKGRGTPAEVIVTEAIGRLGAEMEAGVVRWCLMLPLVVGEVVGDIGEEPRMGLPLALLGEDVEDVAVTLRAETGICGETRLRIGEVVVVGGEEEVEEDQGHLQGAGQGAGRLRTRLDGGGIESAIWKYISCMLDMQMCE